MAIILRSAEHRMWDEPAPVRVVKAVRGEGRWFKQYVWAELPGDDVEPVVSVAITRRTGIRWRAPRAGERMEILLWSVSDPVKAFADGSFTEPSSGASVCYLVEDSMENQSRQWADRWDKQW